MALYAIGDVQGCDAELETLLKSLRFSADKDRLWFVGDLVNRGPCSLQALRRVRALGDNAVSVLGNHDLHLLAVALAGAKLRKSDTVSDILAARDRDALLEWLLALPLAHFDAEHQMADIDFNVFRNVRRKTLNLDFTQQLLEDAAFRLHAHRFALEHHRNRDGQLLIHRDALQIHVQQRPLDRLILPIDDHGLGLGAVEGEVEDGVVSGLGVQDTGDLARVDGDGKRLLSGAIDHRRNLSFLANPASYGFTNATGSAINSGLNGQGYLFWDAEHPTTAADALIGELAAQSVPEPSMFLIFATSIGLVAATRLKKRHLFWRRPSA